MCILSQSEIVKNHSNEHLSDTTGARLNHYRVCAMEFFSLLFSFYEFEVKARRELQEVLPAQDNANVFVKTSVSAF